MALGSSFTHQQANTSSKTPPHCQLSQDHDPFIKGPSINEDREYYSAIKRYKILLFFDNMGGEREYYAKSNKSGRGRLISITSLNMWTLKKKKQGTNKT